MEHLTNSNILKEIGRRFELARLNAGLTQSEMAEKCGLGLRTIQNLEGGKSNASLLTVISVLRALSLISSIESFLPPPPPVSRSMLTKNNKPRQRASSRKTEKNQNWSWGDE